MNRKIRTLILFLMLALFTGSQVYAQDQDGSLPAPKEEILAESSFQEKSPKAQARKEDQKTEGGQRKEEANLPQDPAKEEEPIAQTGEETGQEDPQKENPDQKSPAQAPKEEALESPAKPAQASPAPTEPTPTEPTAGQDETKTSGEPKDGTGTKPEDKKETPQVDTTADKDLSDLQAQIDAAKKANDKKKEAELGKQYAEKLLKDIETSGADKLNKEVLKRFTDKDKTKEFYEIQAEYEALKKKAEKGTLTKNEVEAFNKKVGSFDPPRKLDADEEAAQKKLTDSVDVPGLEEGKSKDPKAQEKLDAYNKAKKALQDALDADNTKGKAENLEELVKAFEDAEKALKDGIKNGTIKPAYTKGDPTVRVFPLVNGSLGDELKEKDGEDNTYYIPDNTDINLLLHINKDDQPQKFTFKIKAVDKGVKIDGEKASNLAFLNGNPVELIYDADTDSYSFTVNSADTFGIAQLRFNVPGFEGPFHKGFDLEMDLNDTKVTKKFRITKKGYEDEAHLNGPGSDKADDPTKIPQVNAGDTENAKVKEDSAKEIYDFFTYLKKSNTYIDNVTFNSGNGASLPLNSVDITITVPKSGESNFADNFAEMIHKSRLKYHKLGNGKYQLKLNTKVFGGNLTEKDGKLYLKGENGQADKELTPADLNDVILENAGKKVYVDKKSNPHDIITSEVLEDKKGDYKVENGKLYKKNDQSKFDEIGTFDKEGKIKTKDKTYVLDGKKLISYTSEYDVYDGNVANKKEEGSDNYKADPDVTPTYEGNQVTIETEVTKDGKTTTETSYGGTIVEDAIYDKNGKIFKEDDYQGFNVEQVIDASGKKLDLSYDGKEVKEVKDSKGNILYKYFVGDDGKTYRIVKDAVFKGDYIVDGLEYKAGLSLIDKFGKKMNVEVTKDEAGKYTFTRKVKKGDKVETETKYSGTDGDRTIKVEDGQILVDSKNSVVTNNNASKDPYEIVGPKYYFNGTKFEKAEGNGLKGDKFFAGFEKIDLEPTTTKYSYKDGDKTTEIENFDKKRVYEGSLKPEDYFKVEDKIYVKKSQGEGSTAADYYVSADPNASNEILSVNKIPKIVQTLGTGNNAIEKVTDETDIFNAVQNAKFALRFPGFLAGKNIVYNVHADVKATYSKPNPETGELEDTDVFSDKNGVKKIDKFFTLKNEKKSSTFFFKNAPEELGKTPDYHFFNIFYRGLNDRDRDALITDLLNTKKTEGEKTKQNEDNLTEDQKKAQEVVKAKLTLLDKLQGELSRLYNGAEFVLSKNGETFEIQRNGEKVEIERSLLWEIGFKNTEGALFPENKDTEIIIEDHSMDNRLVYDEIIVNDTEKNWKNAKTTWDTNNKDKKFPGTDEYFFLNQIKNIKFGVNPNFIEGRFVPLGENFNLKGEEILAALNKNPKAKSVEIEKGDGENKIKFLITRDSAKGQVRIKVLNAFYKKNDTNDTSYKFSSPVQEAYQKKMKEAQTKLDAFGKNDISDASKISDFENTFKELLQVIHKVDTDCYKTIKGKFDEIMTEIKSITDPTKSAEKLEKLNQLKNTLQIEIPKLKLIYLDSKKGDYKNDDMRFNAIHININSGVSMGGALAPQKTKKLGITSVIVPEIDIPYTDEFGNPLTNKDMYVKAEIEKILKDGISQGEGKEPKKFTKDDLKNEEKFREIMAEAYKRVNDRIALTGEDEDKIEIKDLVTVKDANKTKQAWEKYTITKGKDLKYEDLAPNGKDIIKDKAGNSINPWFIGKESVDQRFENMFGLGNFEKKPEYTKLAEKAIDIAAYYMSSQGYDRSRYANQANYKLAGGDKKDGIFGSESDWHKKVCYSGILGKCIEDAGKGIVPGAGPSDGKFGAEENIGADFGLTYEPSHDEPDKENPKVDKSSKEGSVNISDEAKEEDKKVDFTIGVTVDKMTKDQKKIADALTPDKKSETKDKYEGYNKDGYYEYKNSLIIDFLPEIFKLKDDTKLTFEAKKDRLMANGANKDFEDNSKFENWKNGIEYFYTDDLEAYAKTLTDKEKAEVLNKAIEEAKASGKIKEGQKVQAVLAWVPTFEAPHGSERQFTFTLSKLAVDKKKFKDFDDGIDGTNYTNHAAFGDKARFYFGETTVNIHKDKHGKVNKYLQLLDKDGNAIDKDGNVIDKDKAESWFKGSAELKFGDKFNYRIEYKNNNNNIVQVPGEAHSKPEINIEDLFDKASDNGLKPVLNGFITNDFEFKNQVTVTYKIGETRYSEDAFRKAIESGKVKFSDVTSVELKGLYENGATHNFYLPMMVPELDAKIEDGNVVYVGKDGEKKILGKADEFFNLGSLTDKDAEMAFDNSVKGSNTVTVYLKKERFIKVFKEFLDANGEKLKNLDNLEAKFDVYQIIEENGVKKRVKVGELVANKANDFTDMLEHLPIFKKTTTIDKDGKVTVKEDVKYEYELEEVPMAGFEGKVWKLDDSDGLGFVWKAKNTEKPERPPHNPPEEPKTPPETPPEEPGKPPETPGEKPKYPQDIPGDTPGKPRKPRTPNNLPKTGLVEDLGLVYLSGLALAGLVLLRKKYFLD